jgi:hypothetical protein
MRAAFDQSLSREKGFEKGPLPKLNGKGPTF